MYNDRYTYMSLNTPTTVRNNTTRQTKIILPWHTRRWREVCPQITERINSIIELDTLLTALSSTQFGPSDLKLRPKQFSDLFNIYSADEQYAAHRITADDVIHRLIPCMQRLLLGAPKLFKGFDARALTANGTSTSPNVPPSRDNNENILSTNIVLTRPQVATLITCMWFGLFDYDYVTKGNHTVDDFPVPVLLPNICNGRNVFALQCLLVYFDMVSTNIEDDNFINGVVILKRSQFIREAPVDWINSTSPVCRIEVSKEMYVDRERAPVLTVFAHEYIGGDMFKQASLTQEETILLIFPECLVSTIFCSVLDLASTLAIYGAEKLSAYGGYGASTSYIGRYSDDTSRGRIGRDVMIQRCIIFADASPRTSVKSQFIDDFMRDLDKLWCGYSAASFSRDSVPVSGGNWSYGFNGANMQVKLLQQILAASQAGKSLIYCPVGAIVDKLNEYMFYLRNEDYEFTVGGLIRAYLKVIDETYTGPNSRLHDLDLMSNIIQHMLF